MFHNLGTVEMEDQIGVTKKLVEKYPFIDPARVGIWGWSYGGYATLKTLAADKGWSYYNARIVNFWLQGNYYRSYTALVYELVVCDLVPV